METKEELIEEKLRYEKLLLTAIEIYHRIPAKLQSAYDKEIKEYIKELKMLNQRIWRMK